METIKDQIKKIPYAKSIYSGSKARLKDAKMGILDRVAPAEAAKARATEQYMANKRLAEGPILEAPKFIGIEINNTCNLNCVMCETQTSKRTRGMIDFELFKSVVDQMVGFGIRRTHFHTINEPLMNGAIFDLLEYCNEKGVEVEISTNGMLVGRFIKRYEQEKRTFRNFMFRFSIDGGTKETFEKMRVGGNWEKLLKNVEELFKFRERNGMDFRIAAKCVVSEDTMKELGDFYNKFKGFFGNDLSFVLLNTLSATGETNEYITNHSEIFKRHWRARGCTLPKGSMWVLWNGDVSVCCRDFEGEVTIGNVNNNSLKEIWNNHAHKELVAAQKAGDSKKLCALCNNCYNPREYLNQLVKINLRDRLLKGTPNNEHVASEVKKIIAENDANVDRWYL